jgi:hypothetical protein
MNSKIEMERRSLFSKKNRSLADGMSKANLIVDTGTLTSEVCNEKF